LYFRIDVISSFRGITGNRQNNLLKVLVINCPGHFTAGNRLKPAAAACINQPSPDSGQQNGQDNAVAGMPQIRIEAIHFILCPNYNQDVGNCSAQTQICRMPQTYLGKMEPGQKARKILKRTTGLAKICKSALESKAQHTHSESA
jgi:hypothetical protein